MLVQAECASEAKAKVHDTSPITIIIIEALFILVFSLYIFSHFISFEVLAHIKLSSTSLLLKVEMHEAPLHSVHK